jgi:hypothetical protein
MSQFHYEEGSLSIIESRCPGDSTDEYLRNIPDSLCVLRSLQPLDSFTPNGLGTQYSTSQASTNLEPLEDWGIYVERGWDPWITIAVGPFNIYLVALETRLAAMALQYFQVVHDYTLCSLLLMFLYYLVFLLPMLAASNTRDDFRIRPVDFCMAFVWVRAFLVEHMLKRRTLNVLLLCMLSCVCIKYRTLADFVAFLVFYTYTNNGVCTPQLVRVLCYLFAVNPEHLWAVLVESSDEVKLNFWPIISHWSIFLGPGCSFLILRTVESIDSLIQARTNISPIGMFSQTAKHIGAIINSIFGKPWAIMIGIPLYIFVLWWWIGRMSYFELMKYEPSAPQCSEKNIRRYKQGHLFSFLTRKSLKKFKSGLKWTSCELRSFGRWRKHRYRQEGKLCQRLRKVSRVRPRRSSCVK